MSDNDKPVSTEEQIDSIAVPLIINMSLQMNGFSDDLTEMATLTAVRYIRFRDKVSGATLSELDDMIKARTKASKIIKATPSGLNGTLPFAPRN